MRRLDLHASYAPSQLPRRFGGSAGLILGDPLSDRLMAHQRLRQKPRALQEQLLDRAARLMRVLFLGQTALVAGELRSLKLRAHVRELAPGRTQVASIHVDVSKGRLRAVNRF